LLNMVVHLVKYPRIFACLLVLCAPTSRALRKTPTQLSDSLSSPSRASRDFAHLFKKNGEAYTNPKDVLQGMNFHIVVGIAVSPGNLADRKLHRDTWFKSPLVCQGDFGTPAGCVVLPKFIADSGSMLSQRGPASQVLVALQEEHRAHKDIEFIEGVVADKTRQWLAQAVVRYPRADYIGKMDSDTYLSPRVMVDDLVKQLKISPVIDYYGHLLGHDTGGFLSETDGCNASTECCNPPEGCLVGEDPFADGCWVYAQGGFYLVSRVVARHVGRLLQEGQPSAMDYSCEDAILGKWVQTAPSKRAVVGLGTTFCGCECLQSEIYGWSHMYYSTNQDLDQDERCK